MAHVKRFEEFRNEQNSVNELFKSKEKKAEKEAAISAFEDKLKEYQDKGFDVNVKGLTKQAEDNKYRGNLKAVKSRKSGKVVVIYKDGLTTLQKFASGAGSATRGESVEGDEMHDASGVNESEDGFEYMEDDCEDMEDDCEDMEESMSDDDCEDIEEFDFEGDEDYEAVQELFNSKEKKAEREKTKAEVEAKLDEYEGKGYKVQRDHIMKQAETNKFRGNLKAVKSRKSGKVVVIWQDGLTALQKLATGAGAARRDALGM